MGNSFRLRTGVIYCALSDAGAARQGAINYACTKYFDLRIKRFKLDTSSIAPLHRISGVKHEISFDFAQGRLFAQEDE